MNRERLGTAVSIFIAMVGSSVALGQPGTGGSSAAPAQSSTPATTSTPTPPVATSPRQTLLKMQRLISLDVKDRRLEDIVKFIQEITQADMEPLWAGDSGIGLDKEKLITVKMVNRPALTVLEAVLDKAKGDATQSNGWQMAEEGTLQFGPKELLNKSRRLVVYDINDLLLIIPNYPDVPQIDLNSVLQQSKGGSGQSPFQNANQNRQLTPQQIDAQREANAKKVQDIITTNVESEQWIDNGGDGASIRYWNGTFLVNAPDYIHRQIAGYPYWPNSTTTVAGGRRYVSLNMDTGASKVNGIAQSQVSAIAGGQPVSSGGAGSGGTGGGGSGGGGGK